MQRYNVSEARKNISTILDAAERGESVEISRNDRVFKIVVDNAPQKKRTRKKREPVFEAIDQDIENGLWTFEYTQSGLTFKSKRRKSR